MNRLPSNHKNNLKFSSSHGGQVNFSPGAPNGSSHVTAELPQLLPAQPVALTTQNISNDVEESEDDMEWEEVDIMQNNMESALPTQAVEVVIEDTTKTPK